MASDDERKLNGARRIFKERAPWIDAPGEKTRRGFEII
jgi:hypothetical protein